MNAGVRLRFGGFLVSLAGRKGFTNDAPDWGVFALVTYQMNVGSPLRREGGGRAGPAAGAPGAGARRAGRRARRAPGAGLPGAARGPAAPGAPARRRRPGPPALRPGPGRRGPRRRRPGPAAPGAGARCAGCARRARSARRPALRAPQGRLRAVPPAALPPSLRSALRDINFQFDQYSLTDDAKATLDELGQALKANPQFAVTIEGHADERGTVEYNLALAEQRAQAAKAYLVALGIDASRVDTISYGEQRPVDAGHDELAWAINRRAHFLVRGR